MYITVVLAYLILYISVFLISPAGDDSGEGTGR